MQPNTETELLASEAQAIQADMGGALARLAGLSGALIDPRPWVRRYPLTAVTTTAVVSSAVVSGLGRRPRGDSDAGGRQGGRSELLGLVRQAAVSALLGQLLPAGGPDTDAAGAA